MFDASDLQEVYTILRDYPTLGPFLAFQLVVDLNYSTLLTFSEMDFVVVGPGAHSGIRKCFSDLGGFSDEDVVRLMVEIAESEFHRLGLSFRNLWGRPLQPIDCQNLFCEVDKYARIAHPEVQGTSGRTRIKQSFAPVAEPMPQWYPPKWGLRPSGVLPTDSKRTNTGAVAV